MEQDRKVIKELQSRLTLDGAGVTLRRSIGTEDLSHLDPFLLLDAFGSDHPDDYIAGFPNHPHRGFETVTYMIAGKMRHKDSSGSEGILLPGGVQWMTAGRGVIHSEMPEQVEGELRGFQLWVNLPANKKMTVPRYQNLAPEAIEEANLGNGVTVKVIAGEVAGVKGAVTGICTEPIFLDVHGEKGSKVSQKIPIAHTCFLYVYEGNVSVAGKKIQEHTIAILGKGGNVCLEFEIDARAILVAGKPLKEPVSRLGPFVMNTREEIHQAMIDFKSGRFLD